MTPGIAARAPIVLRLTGWSEPVPGREFHALKSNALSLPHCYANNPLRQLNSLLIFTMTVRASIMAACLSIGFLSVLFSQSNPKATPEPKFAAPGSLR
jgi:hypothetical protein